MIKKSFNIIIGNWKQENSKDDNSIMINNLKII